MSDIRGLAAVPAWRKSSYSSDTGGECVEVADLDLGTGVRDSKHPEAGHLLFPSSEWTGFLKNLR